MAKYLKEIMDDLIKNNPFFNIPAEKRYKIFVDVDPFPNITASLLNSADIIKYVMTTGMIDEFKIENLSGAIYTCEISGEYIYWDEKKVQNKATLHDKAEELVLLPNSITFIAVKQYFRIPSYKVLRFNLRVSHVYKGLLLGTGPIVDPCFNGQIYIPLHNLTSNEYIIKKDALMIDIEFTKMSKNSIWDLNNNNDHKDIVNALDFSNIDYRCNEIKPGRPFTEYIDKALSKDDLFHKKDRERIFINSSLPEEIHKFESKINEYDKIMDTNAKDNEKLIKDIKSTENFVKALSVFSIVSILIAALALFATAGNYFSNSTKFQDAQKSIENQERKYEEAQNVYKIKIDEMQKRIDYLEKK